MAKRPMIIGVFITLLISMTPALSDAVVDFSGDWNGTWYSTTENIRGRLFISLSQDGTIVDGTFTLFGGLCSPINDEPLTGSVNGTVLSFNVTITCGGNTGIWKSSQVVLTNNEISSDYSFYEQGELFGEGYFNVTRSINYIKTTAESGGTITPNGEISVNAGTDQTFAILPDNGYEILDVVVDGTSMGAAISSYTFSDVSANHTISATFQIAQNRATVSGIVKYNSEPLCAMVLANGQYMFTCKDGDDFGKYELDVPLDANQEITIQAFVSGLAPFRQTTDETDLDIDIAMQTADPESKSPDVTTVNQFDASTPANWARITGTVTLDGTPLCAMVLANGKYMFSCNANNGVYDLTVPLDGNGQITLFVFVSGLQPYKHTFTP